jgi:hypothetical protein
VTSQRLSVRLTPLLPDDPGHHDIPDNGCPDGRGFQRRRSEHGQALPLAALVLAVAAVLVVGLARLGDRVSDSARARTAADAAALAGATNGQAAARRVAAANGGTLTSYREIDDLTVEVVVEVDGAMSAARAQIAIVDR